MGWRVDFMDATAAEAHEEEGRRIMDQFHRSSSTSSVRAPGRAAYAIAIDRAGE